MSLLFCSSPVGMRNPRSNDWVKLRLSEMRKRGVIWRSPKPACRSPSMSNTFEITMGTSVRSSKRRLKGVKSARPLAY